MITAEDLINTTLFVARVDKNSDQPRAVLIDPPNIKTKPVKKGPGIDAVLFSKPGYVAVGDPYIQQNDLLARKEDRATQIKNGNEKPFKPVPARLQFKKYKADFEHMTDFVEIQKNYREEENPRAVKIAPPNIRTNPMKRGQVGKQVTFGGTIPYMEDDFNRPKVIAQAEREYHESKLQEKPFSQRVKKTGQFNTDRQILQENPPIPPRAPKPKTAPTCEHDKPFKPTHPPRVGYNKTIAKFPAYIEDPKKPVTRKMSVGEEEKPKFKPTHLYKTRPTPSVATNLRNIKSAFPSVFRR